MTSLGSVCEVAIFADTLFYPNVSGSPNGLLRFLPHVARSGVHRSGVNLADRSYKTSIAFLGAANADQCYALTPPNELYNFSFDYILGYRVLHLEWSNPAQDGSTTIIETWVALLLGCLPLKQVVRILDRPGRTVCQRITVAQAVIPGEPDSRLFAIPPSWAEVSPNTFSIDRADSACEPGFIELRELVHSRQLLR